MSTDKPNPTTADYLASAVSPALIMALVGSLVFFLVEILYAGQYTGRLLWTLFFFVFGIVLISRISMSGDISNRAQLYGLILGVLVWLGLQSYVEYPKDSWLAPWNWAVHLGWIAIIWWCASRLTWDCTFMEDASRATGTGLLDAAGLERPSGGQESSKTDDAEAVAESAEEAEAPSSWWKRYQRYRQERQKRHTPGVWVIYFSLAALPIFGLGQSLIRADEITRRRYVFWLMIFYVGAGLGLLLCTCFLGLRRYLRQRRLRMPAAMTGVWLTFGVALIVIVLVVGALLPRPHPEYPLLELARFKSQQRDASNFAVGNGGAGRGQGRGGGEQPRQGQTPENGSGEGSAKANDSNADGSRAGGNNGRSAGDQSGGRQSGQQEQKSSGSPQKNSESSSNGENKASQPESSSNGENKASQSENSGEPRQGSSAEAKKGSGEQQREGKNAKDDRSAQSDASKGTQNRGGSRPPGGHESASAFSSLGSFLSSLAVLLKWIVFAIVALAIAVVLFRSLLAFLANFTNWAAQLLAFFRSWWQGLLLWTRRESEDAASGDPEDRALPPLPFADFSNPFKDGRAANMPPGALLRYSFAALQSWAWERDLGRRPHETALEFADRIGSETPALENNVRAFASVYVRLLYARGVVPGSYRVVTEQFWQRLEAVTEQPLSA